MRDLPSLSTVWSRVYEAILLQPRRCEAHHGRRGIVPVYSDVMNNRSCHLDDTTHSDKSYPGHALLFPSCARSVLDFSQNVGNK